MFNEDDLITVTNITLEKMRVAASVKIGNAMLRDMRLEVKSDVISDALMATLNTYVVTQELVKDEYKVAETKRIYTPKSWWDHLKRDHAPSWFLSRFPVENECHRVHFQKTIKITRKEAYPMTSIAMDQNRQFSQMMGTPVIKDIVEQD